MTVDLSVHPPRSTALIVGSARETISYGQLDAAVSGAARAHTDHGFRRGDVIALTAANTAEFVVDLLGAIRAGLIVAPMDPALPQSGTRQRLDLLGSLRHGGPGGLTDDDAMVMFTSGTTGIPKMVPWTRQAITASTASVARTYGLTEADSTVAAMPLFHGHGLIATLLTSLTVGGTVLLPAAGRFSAHTFRDDLAAARATWYTAVPTIHRIALTTRESRPGDTARAAAALRFVRSCSAPLAPETAAGLESEFGVPVLPAYGMTEATHHVSGCTLGDTTDVRRRSVGTPAAATARIVDGEVWVTGAAIARGYLGDRALSSGTFVEGWLRTGDLGAIDASGNLSVTGRIKNIINRGGEKISPERVEQILAGCPGVAQAAVFPLPDPVYGEGVGAAGVATPGIRPTTGELIAGCRGRLAKYEVPEHIAIVDALPLTAKGDIDRAALVHSSGSSSNSQLSLSPTGAAVT